VHARYAPNPIALGTRVRDNAPPLNPLPRNNRTPPAQLFGLVNEFVLLLLGALMILLAVSGRFALPRGSIAWIAVGVFLMYWGVRAWTVRGAGGRSWQTNLRGASLVLVGALMLLMRWLPTQYAPLLLGCAGGLLILRGLLGAALLVARR
jgi:hypothetical protein